MQFFEFEVCLTLIAGYITSGNLFLQHVIIAPQVDR